MSDIPSNINGVTIEFSSLVNKSVDPRVVDALKLIVKTNIATSKVLNKLYISSANDQHKSPSRHVQGKGKAVDISRINDMKLSVYYNKDPAVKAIADAIQDEFEKYQHRRENFGPYFKKKLGKTHAMSGHGDHIHLSVN